MISNYAVAKALMDQHEFCHDVAYLSVWYTIHDKPPKESSDQVLARIMRCKHVPTISAQFAEALHCAYKRRGSKTVLEYKI